MIQTAFLGCPTFFRARCDEATRGGQSSYANVGRELFRHTESLIPWSVDRDDWLVECERLDDLIEAGDDAAVIQWFRDHYPNCMDLVPNNRHETFLLGVYDLADQ